ncbi:hypothetical protein G3N59_03670 [Paraburkholderia sp. Ac-20340]|uniref:hypothetical protein n=1 Tax=Paraburkholderia sp. Ac-20340 TaxID=2703888 RepID=UPI0019812523|nr:hypothetical protein [Paraburkholderia sp. Ac-20340]MBN3852472.1 hypothetical protein [Paraburkholderia sp. Ac-20340]
MSNVIQMNFAAASTITRRSWGMGASAVVQVRVDTAAHEVWFGANGRGARSETRPVMIGGARFARGAPRSQPG